MNIKKEISLKPATGFTTVPPNDNVHKWVVVKYFETVSIYDDLVFKDNIKYFYNDYDITELLKNHKHIVLHYLDKFDDFLKIYVDNNEIINDPNLRKILL